MKTPDEIKKGLECCTPRWVANHWKSCSSKCPYITLSASCRGKLVYDALAYIQQLEARIDTLNAKTVLFDEAVAAGEKYKRERDAAVERLAKYKKCIDCIFYVNVVNANMLCDGCEFGSNWQWRGVQEEGKT